VPLALREATVGELRALLATDTVPEMLPTTVGANWIPRLLDCPGANVSGKLNPLTLKPAPETVACEILKLVVPELVRVTVWLPAVPTVTFPKLRALGVIESVRFTPLPLRETLVGEFGAVLSNETVPVALPVMVGANCICKVLDCPA
jgi:hypothetical protein